MGGKSGTVLPSSDLGMRHTLHLHASSKGTWARMGRINLHFEFTTHSTSIGRFRHNLNVWYLAYAMTCSGQPMNGSLFYSSPISLGPTHRPQKDGKLGWLAGSQPRTLGSEWTRPGGLLTSSRACRLRDIACHSLAGRRRFTRMSSISGLLAA